MAKGFGDWRRVRLIDRRAHFTLRFSAACLPRLSTTSKSTFAPSARPLKPAFSTALVCKNMSLPPSSGAMKPNPLAALNHFTVPLGTAALPSSKQSCEVNSAADHGATLNTVRLNRRCDCRDRWHRYRHSMSSKIAYDVYRG